MAVEDIISIERLRSTIQDPIHRKFDEYYLEGPRSAVELDFKPVIKDDEKHPFEIRLDGEDLNEENYELFPESALVKFTNNFEEESGLLEVIYYHAMLTNDELQRAIDEAITHHLPDVDEEDEDYEKILREEAPYITWLASAKSFYSLASKWATETRIRTDDIEIYDGQTAQRFFELGEKMEDKYQDASAGAINVGTLTRRDVDTGEFYPDPAEVYD